MCCYERNLYIGSGKKLNMDREILSVKQYLVHKCKYTNSMDITSKLEQRDKWILICPKARKTKVTEFLGKEIKTICQKTIPENET